MKSLILLAVVATLFSQACFASSLCVNEGLTVADKISRSIAVDAFIEIGDTFTFKTKSKITFFKGSDSLECGNLLFDYSSARMDRHIPAEKTYTFKVTRNYPCFELNNSNKESILKSFTVCDPNLHSQKDMIAALNNCNLFQFVKADPNYTSSVEVQ